MVKKEDINVEELLQLIIQEFIKIIPCRVIDFPQTVSAAVAKDVESDNPRFGYMEYKSALICELNRKITWILCIGTTWGYYPAKPFYGDIIAFEILSPEEKSDDEISAEIENRIRSGAYFKNSLIIALQNGQIIVSKDQNRFRQRMNEFLRPVLPVYVSPTALTPVRYKPELAEKLAKGIMEILNKMK